MRWNDELNESTLHHFGLAGWVQRKQPLEMVQVAQACVDALDEIQSLERANASLRRELEDPPGDVQERVLRKLNLWPPPAPVEIRDPYRPKNTGDV